MPKAMPYENKSFSYVSYNHLYKDAYSSHYLHKKLESYLLKNIEMVIITSLSHPIRQRSTIVSTDDKKDLSPLHTTDEIYK